MKKSGLIFLLPTLLFGASVAVNNDSAFPLHAQIIAATGDVLGAISVPPQQQMSWLNSSLESGNNPMVPYTVILYCLEGTEFGIINTVSNGETVFASQAQGRKVCKPQTKEMKKKEKEALKKDPSLRNVNPEQWNRSQLNNDF